MHTCDCSVSECKINQFPGDNCQVLWEVRHPKEAREKYHELLRERSAELSAQSFVDVPYKLQRIGVPGDTILAVRSPQQTLALDWAKKFIIAPKNLIRSIVFAGVRGIGKSVAAAWVLGDAIRHYEWNSAPSGLRAWEPFVWARASDVTRVTDFGKVDPEWLEGLRRCRVLVLDDLGQDATQPGLLALRDLLIFRHENQRRTVVTSNLLPPDFKHRYGESWFDRMASASMFPVLTNEKNLRKRSAA